MEDEHPNFSLLVEEGGAGDGFLARWPPQRFANSGFLSTFAGHRALAPIASCAFLAPGSEPSHRIINNLHDSVRELLNQTLRDWVQIAVLGVLKLAYIKTSSASSLSSRYSSPGLSSWEHL